MKEKFCVVHIPNYIDLNGKSGSSIRPRKMVEAFESCGYHVDFVMGYGADRKEKIKKIKENIRNGVKYDFLYSENSTTPTLLTEKNHLPRYPHLDFGFMGFCKKNGIKIGLFYRDIYWKFEVYKKEVPLFKRCISIPFYKYYFYQYNILLDILYLLSAKMRPYVSEVSKYKPLPPGCDIDKEIIKYKKEEQGKDSKVLNLFYVGGVGDLYDLTELLLAVRNLDFVQLTVCCRKEEWNARQHYYRQYMGDNITVVHNSGKDLLPYYRQADICMLFFESSGYRGFAMPIKLFEYLSMQTPVIATQGSAAGDFVEQNDIGWNIGYDRNELEELLNQINTNRNLLEEKRGNLETALMKNSWKARAEQVIQDLK